MAHENKAAHYSDWQTTVHCSFQNVFTANIGHIVGNNLQSILGITHFKSNEMAKQAPLPYEFTCKRREANSIRDALESITTDPFSHIWFSMQTDPFHFISNRRSMLADDPIQVRDYPVYFHFGSMYSYNTFNMHSEEHPAIHDVRILKWKDEPETIRIMSKDKSRQIFLPIKWIQKSILVNLKTRPCIVLMLKYSVQMKRKIMVNGQSMDERVCKSGDNGFETIVSKSSDLMLTFSDPDHTYAFLEELTHETDGYRNKFTINFVSLKRISVKKSDHFDFPSSASYKQHYALKMLFSMGYLFQDKYSPKIHEQFLGFNKELFPEMCYYLKNKLEDNHCYYVNRILDDFAAYWKEKRREERQLDGKQLPHSFGCVSITPLRILYQRMESSMGNRALRMREFGGDEMFLLIHIREEDNSKLKAFDSSIKRRLKSKMLHGIQLMGKTYRLFGTSTSQLKEMSFWFIAIENQTIEQAWRKLGDFSSINNLANYVARIGLYFTTSTDTGISLEYSEKFSPEKQLSVTKINDIKTENNKYCFTDGIGKLSWGLAGLVALKLNLKLECQEDIPSAYQVRIAGCKGMLAIDPQSTLDQYYIQYRPSMEKFQSNQWNLEICDYSRPLELKFNNQVIMLLADLGNSNAIFESYQNAAMTNLSNGNENEQVRRLRYSLAKDDLLKNRIPLPLREARNMFGVVDETGLLEYGQVFIQYKDLDAPNENLFIVVTGEVLVAKMPCLYPGDFRKLTAIHVPALKTSIRDCIVFPRKGPRPHSHEMSGSDLDGDQYWVYWGKQLKIRQMDEPLSYDAAVKKEVSNITYDLVIDHIIDSFGAASQGIICDVHLAIADFHSEHTRSAECKYLAELFSRAVDAPKTGEIIDLDRVYQLRAKFCRGYPQFMKRYDQPIRESNTILNRLFLRARRQFFTQRSSASSVPPPVVALGKAGGQRKAGSNIQDKQFQQWLLSHAVQGGAGEEKNGNEPKPVLVNTSTTKKPPSKNTDITSKDVEAKLSQSLTQQPTASSNKPEKKSISKKEDGESESGQASSIKGKRASVDVKPPELLREQSATTSDKPTKKRVTKKDGDIPSEPPEAASPSIKGKKTSDDPKLSGSSSMETGKFKATVETLINSAASGVTPKSLSSTASATSETMIISRNLIFNGMKTVTNRLQWKQSHDGSFIVDLDTKTNSDNNAVDKLVQLMIDSGKTSFPPGAKLTLIISWGELFLNMSPITDETKPKNIKELNQLINESDRVQFSFREHDVTTITKERDPSKKLSVEYNLLCQCREISSNDLTLIFDEKKKLKKLLFSSINWTCAVRGTDESKDSFYQIRLTTDEIDSKHPSFSNSLKSIFHDPNKTDLLSGTSPQISIDNRLLRSSVQILSLKRSVGQEFNQRRSNLSSFDTLPNLEYSFYEITHISTEKINGKMQTRDTMEFHATPIQLAKKHKQDLEQLAKFAGEFFH